MSTDDQVSVGPSRRQGRPVSGYTRKKGASTSKSKAPEAPKSAQVQHHIDELSGGCGAGKASFEDLFKEETPAKLSSEEWLEVLGHMVHVLRPLHEELREAHSKASVEMAELRDPQDQYFWDEKWKQWTAKRNTILKRWARRSADTQPEDIDLSDFKSVARHLAVAEIAPSHHDGLVEHDGNDSPLAELTDFVDYEIASTEARVKALVNFHEPQERLSHDELEQYAAG